MRASVIWSLLLVAVVLVAAGCGSDSQKPKDRIAESCERQIEQLKEISEESTTKEAKSSEERTEAEDLVECAGQPVEHGSDTGSDGGDGGEGEGADDEKAGGEGDMAADEGGATLTPAVVTEQRATFTKSCATCHALADAEADGSFGPNLDETDMSVEDMKEQIEEGGGGMPSGLLMGDDAQAMADYIAQVRTAQ